MKMMKAVIPKKQANGLDMWQVLGDEPNPYHEVDIKSTVLNEYNDLSPNQREDFDHAFNEDLVDIANKLTNNPTKYNDRRKNKFYRRMAQVTFDLPDNFTYKASKSIIDEFGEDYVCRFFENVTSATGVKKFRKKHGKDYTLDHEWPRQQSARLMIEEYQEKEYSYTYFCELWLQKYSHVNFVSTEENSALSKYVELRGFKNPNHLYEECRIQLVSLK